MQNSEFETLDDLVFSWSFRNWALDKDCPEAGFWENWVIGSPDRLDLVSHAKAVIYALQLHGRSLSAAETDREIEKALGRIKNVPVGFGFGSVEISGDSRLAGATPFEGRHIRSIELIALFCSICLVAYLLFRTHSISFSGPQVKLDSVSRIKMPAKTY